jgi:hypothetical protein
MAKNVADVMVETLAVAGVTRLTCFVKPESNLWQHPAAG